MILFIILLLTLFILIGLTIAIVSAVGAAGIVLFGDVIVCIVLIVLLMRFLSRRKRR